MSVKLNVFINCPGSWSNGLDSPSRGEGRWAYNYARLLSAMGHNVYASSGGDPDRSTHDGVSLLPGKRWDQQPHIDIYIDSAWWKGKEPIAKADKYVSLHWSLEEHLREGSLPDNFYIAYPYPTHMINFRNNNTRTKTFALPTEFCITPNQPNWSASKIFIPGKLDESLQYQKYVPKMAEFLSKHPLEGSSRSQYERIFKDSLRFDDPNSYWYESIPYNEVIESIRRSKISVPFLKPGAMIECALNGVPSLCWTEGGFFNEIAKSLDILIPQNGEPEVLIEICQELMISKKRHAEVTRALQDYFSSHERHKAIQYFNLMLETIM